MTKRSAILSLICCMTFFAVLAGTVNAYEFPGSPFALSAEQPLFGAKLEKADFQPGHWVLDKDGILVAAKPTDIWTKEKYGSFVCSFQYKVSPGANAGFLIQCTDKKDWIPNTLEIQLHDSYGQEPNYHINGALYGYSAPNQNVEKPAGEWNTMKVTCLGKKIWIALNGKTINTIDTSKWTDCKKSPFGTDIEEKFQGHSLASASPFGYIGFQGLHGKAQAPVYIKDLKIQKIQFVGQDKLESWPLLFGKKLENADFDPKIWSIDADGILHATQDVAIWSKEKYKNFLLSFEFKTAKEANSGVIIKCSDKQNWIPNALEVQIYDSCGDPATYSSCGSIFGRCAPFYNTCKPAEVWNQMTVACFEDDIYVQLNGEIITFMKKSDYKDKVKNPDGTEAMPWLRAHAPAELQDNGFLGFQGLHHKVPVEYRNVRIKTL